MTENKDISGASRVSKVRTFLAEHYAADAEEGRDGNREFTWVDRPSGTYALAGADIMAVLLALDVARHRSEDYELRAGAAEATLAQVREWAQEVNATPVTGTFAFGKIAGAMIVLNILDGVSA
jgi:hypothetical protein